MEGRSLGDVCFLKRDRMSRKKGKVTATHVPLT